jgi:glycosyltransferase involved in cell wall biosynthesis
MHPAPEEIIIVADGEGDGSWRAAREVGLNVIRLEDSGGPAVARNAAARAAKGEILFFIDADCTAHANVVGKVKHAFAEDPELAALIGSYDDSPSEKDWLSQYRNLLHHYTHQVSSGEGFTFWGACGAIRRDVFQKVGGFSRHYAKPSIEDIEFGYRITAAGYRIRVVKDIFVKHLKYWSPWNVIRTDLMQRALPWSILILRDKRANNDLNLSTGNRISVATMGLACLAVLLSPFKWKLLWIVPIAAIVIAICNWRQYLFFYRKRGLLFMLAMIPWNWLFYFYSGLGFGMALARVRLGPKPAVAANVVSGESS